MKILIMHQLILCHGNTYFEIAVPWDGSTVEWTIARKLLVTII